jgi:hypothetical protein
MPPKKPPGLYDVVVLTANLHNPRRTTTVEGRFNGLPARTAARRAVEAAKTTPDTTVRAYIVPAGTAPDVSAVIQAPLMVCRRGVRDSPDVQWRMMEANYRRMSTAAPGAVIRNPVTCVFTPTAAVRAPTAFERELKQKAKKRTRKRS